MLEENPLPLPIKKLQQWQEFILAMENAPVDGLVAVDNEGMVLLSQGAARKSLDINTGNHLRNALPELWPKLARTLEDQERRIEVSISKGGVVHYLAWIEPLMLDSAAMGALCIFVESAEMRGVANHMNTFQDLTRELNAIIDSSSDGLWVCDANGTIIRVNPASERINDVKAEDIIGRSTQELCDKGIIARSVFQEVLERKSVASLLTQSRNGRKFIATGTPVFDAQEKVMRVVISERDITEIDRLQRELEEQEAIKNQFRYQIAEMQQADLKSRKVIAKSPCMLKALNQAMKVSEVDSTVLILGESGVGKGLFADLIHKNSSRAEKPIIKINCGAIPESLIEAELFGYEKGAFTGAQSSKAGHFELADEGILFLDEIAELPPSAQVKLLRFLEDGQILRLGGTKERTVDVRVLAATHRNLEEMVRQERFRLDLFYRLNVIPLYIPAVKERKDCILPLIRYYLDYFTKKTGFKKRLSLAATDTLLSYSYPGNVRELMNICERLVVMSETELIDLRDLPGDILGFLQEGEPSTIDLPQHMTLPQALESMEKSILIRFYERYRNQYKMASALGVTQATIARKLQKYGIKKHPETN